ncbi:MAG: PAS domain S-box protein [Flavobacteriales bacterium]|nr:PAS domain S-box protein [Flavobacteriales bacterium]
MSSSTKLKTPSSRYQSLVENLPVGVLIINKNNGIDYANPHAVEMLGIKPEDYENLKPVQFLHPSYNHEFDLLIKGIKNESSPGFIELKVQRLDRPKVLEVEASGGMLNDGSVQLMLHDISTRKQLAREQLRAQIAEETNLQLQREIIERNKAEKDLLQAQKYARSIIDSSLDMIVATDIDYNINEFNAAAESTFGYTKEEVLGKNISVLFSDEGEMAKVLKKINEQGSLANEIINKKKDGTFFISFLSASVLRNEHGEAVGAMGVSRDITAIKKAEEELRLSEERHRAIYDQAYIGIARIAKMGRFLLVNERLCDMLDYSADELYKKTFYELGVQEEVEESLVDWDQLLSGKIKNFSREQTYVRKDGAILSANVTVSLVRDSNNNPNYFVAVFEDITERKEYEKQLEESIKEKEVLLKEVHHRVKNNMQVISSILNLQSSYITDENALGIIRESQDRIKSMSFVHESLYQSKTLSEVNFAEYIQNITRNLYHSYGRPEGGIELEFDLDNIYLNLDTSIPCGLIINEVVSNSLKYAFEGRDSGKIRVEFKKKSDEKMKLIISDDGIGLPKDFDIENAESLGLQLVTTLVTQVSGKLDIDVTNGTSFNIEFKEQ